MVSAGWSPSGVYHIGNSREAVTCNAINLALKDQGAKSKFVFVIDDFDPLDKIPNDLGKYSKQLRPYLGHPLINIPDFTETTNNYSEYFTNKMKNAMNDFNFEINYVKASDEYKQGRYDKFLNIYYENNKKLDTLFSEITGSSLDSYISIICQNCGNAKTTNILEKHQSKVRYECKHDRMYRGCDYEGEVILSDNVWKLKWRLDWPARQTFLDVTVEPSGKDHSVAGGSVDTALAIHKEILGQTPPLLEKYGFITLKGKKFSGSKGGALPASDVSSIMPPSAFLFLIYRTDLLKDIDFNPQSMEYAQLIDEFDLARTMALDIEIEGREREHQKLSTAADLAMFEHERGFKPAEMKFSELALVYQTSLFNIENTVKKMEIMGKIPNKKAKQETYERLKLLKNWLHDLAPESIKFNLLDDIPDNIQNYWSQEIFNIWYEAIQEIDNSTTSEEFTDILRSKGEKYETGPRQYYPPFYRLLTNKPRGPNASNLVIALGKDNLIEKLEKLRSKIE